MPSFKKTAIQLLILAAFLLPFCALAALFAAEATTCAEAPPDPDSPSCFSLVAYLEQTALFLVFWYGALTMVAMVWRRWLLSALFAIALCASLAILPTCLDQAPDALPSFDLQPPHTP